MNKEDIVRILNYYELDKVRYVVISGAALTLLGIVDYAKDIDIYCDEEYYNYLIDNYGAVYERTNEYGIDAYMIDGIINFSFSTGEALYSSSSIKKGTNPSLSP